MTPTVFQLRTTAIAASLRSCQLFVGLPSSDVEEIAGFASTKSLEKGAYLFREGDPVDGFYVVQRGCINVHRVSPMGKEQVIQVFRAGSSFAEAALSTEGGYPADARAIEASNLILIPKQPFIALLGRKPDLAIRLLAAMGMHLRALVGLLEDVTLRDVETRLVNWLLKRCNPGDGNACAIELVTTKRVLAAELGTSSETLSRTFASLREAGILEVAGSTIRITDRPALADRFRSLLGEK